MQPVLNNPQLAPTWAKAERVPQNTITAKNNPLYLSSKNAITYRLIGPLKSRSPILHGEVEKAGELFSKK